MENLYFAKSLENAVIPSKKDEDAGYDVYCVFDEDYLKIDPHETKILHTGIHSAFASDYVIELWERGSTGTKGIAQRCGVIDSGYRGEWAVPITNTTDLPIFIVKKEFLEEHKNSPMFLGCIIYPYEKAICQAIVSTVPKMDVKELLLSELLEITSERGAGRFGSTGK